MSLKPTLALCAVLLIDLAAHAQQAEPRDELLRSDARLTLQRDTDTNFSMTPFADRAAWEDYAAKLRLRILVACGLWPEPARTPLNARVFDTIEHEDYSVSKVHFEAFPGFLVTGNLYSPKGDGPFPAILCPHGHWEHGRLEDGERGSVPARAITFARMGAVALTVDMVGYNDSRQFSFAWGHRPAEVPLEVRRAQELWGIHAFALQLWGNIRALDFLQSLPNVDPERLACTGASGGGTQTFALCAVDDRVDVAAPVNMISHTMQGGCQCENAPLIRIDASNMEIGALFAPKPLMLVSATGDWTKDTPTVEYPAIRSIYELFGATDRVHTHQVDAPHNYNQASREQVYRFFGKWFLNEPEKYANFTEPAYTADPPASVRVFPGEGPLPGHATQDELVAAMIAERRDRIARAVKERGADPEFIAEYRQAVGHMVGIDVAKPDEVVAERVTKTQSDGYTFERWVIHVPHTGAVIPANLWIPDERKSASVDLMVEDELRGLRIDPGGRNPDALYDQMIESGTITGAIGLFGRSRAVENLPRQIGKFADTFVPTDTAYRTQDVLAAIQWMSRQTGNSPVRLLPASGLGLGTEVPCILAASVAPEWVTVRVSASQLPKTDEEWVRLAYLPSLQSLGGVRTIAESLTPGRVEFAK